ncbi:hypothetical protein COU74_01100 [Candidatus Peregrinibacteria bacterium CG10_big_fil_rev_8_21_14_0_10_36_19]|nr:MAG: hypothetical protein COU74_01100 [Candidatus Peregrinibacteria bacterium CG10_big_fil_rev_8_21_14_0_10_36_19]
MTDYKSIFNEMKNGYSGYQDIENLFESNEYDLEKLLGELEGNLKTPGGFLNRFVSNKIKLDFMKAASHLAASQVNNVYQEKNDGIYLLLKNFNNYFTLNYDPFLYLLMMKFKKKDNKNGAVILQGALPFIEDDLDEEQNGIYSKIKEARNNGELSIHVNKNDTRKELSQCTKSTFNTVVKEHFKAENWKAKDIDKAINLVWQEENESHELNINDGFFKDKDFEQPVYKGKQMLNQNLFFLHGAFHIYQNKDTIFKITQKSDKALYERLTEIINNGEENIVCVFKSDEKKEEIEANTYLASAYKKLAELSGSIVLIGCSLSDNDNHVFEQINKSKVDTIYISSKEKNKDEDYSKAKKIFSKKEIILFDRETITYELPNNENE